MEKMHTNNFVIKFLIVCFVLVFIGGKLLAWNETHIKRMNIQDVPIEGTIGDYVLNLDAAEYGYDSSKCENRITIGGWIVKKGNATDQVSIKVALRNLKTGEVFELPTSIVTRTDVTSFFNDGINYDNCGFGVSVKYENTKIDFEKYDYEIFVEYTLNGEKKLIQSNVVL